MTDYVVVETPFGDVHVPASNEPCACCRRPLGSMSDQRFDPEGRLLCADCDASHLWRDRDSFSQCETCGATYDPTTAVTLGGECGPSPARRRHHFGSERELTEAESDVLFDAAERAAESQNRPVGRSEWWPAESRFVHSFPPGGHDPMDPSLAEEQADRAAERER